jgi:hypothetical protein
MNMTWGEFKKAIEELGAKDHEFISCIDVIDPEKKMDLFVTKTEIKSSVVMLHIIGGT